MRGRGLLVMLGIAILIFSVVFAPLPVRSADAQGPGLLKSVYALKYGEFTTFPNYGVYWMGDPRFSSNQPPIVVYMYFWLIQTGDHNILVDTGTGPDWATRYAPWVSPEVLLSKMGLKASDIDTIIVSHPHFDHVDGLEYFKNAMVYIQREAYRFATEDGPESAFIRGSGFPRKKDAAMLLDLAWNGRLKFLDGDAEIFPGIKTIKVGGHHPGLQITVIQTGAKPIVLASDAVHQYVSLEKNIPMGFYQGNFKDVVKALETIRQLNGVVVSGHDRQVVERFKLVQEGVVRVYPY
jgi:glyoxylase-like metal-dependent hydrolase (beta-lactamase superfamily II)